MPRTTGPVAPMAEQHWRTLAACRGMDPDLFYPTRGEDSWDVRQVCKGCPVRTECLQFALDNNETFGIWGGTSAKERWRTRRLIRKQAS